MTAPALELLRDEPTGGEPVLIRPGTDAELTDELLAPLWARWPWFRYALGVTGLGTLVLFSARRRTRSSPASASGATTSRSRGRSRSSTSSGGSGSATPARSSRAILLLLEQTLAHVDQPLRRGDDALRGHAGGALPAPAPRAARGSRTGSSRTRPTMGVWPQFRSALPWDVAAVTTYFTVSLLFWYSGLLPDLAALRDRAPTLLRAPHLRHLRARLARLGARTGATTGSRTWSSAGSRRRSSSRCTRSSASTSPSRSCPGWHSTIFPPYFVAGAIFSGFAMVLHADDPGARDLRARERHHAEPPRQHGEDAPRDRLDRHLLVHRRALHRLVQRRPLRDVRRTSSTGRSAPYALGLLGRHLLQLRRAAGALVDAACGRAPRRSSSSRASSTSGCGRSAS